MSRSWPLLLVLGTLGVVACGDGPLWPEHGPSLPPDARPYVTGNALAGLDSFGRFRLPPPVISGPYASISAEEAGAIADAYVRTWISNPNAVSIGFRESLVEQHGGDIAWDQLRKSPLPPYFAESHLEPVPAELGLAAVRHFGPHYLTPYYIDAVPTLVVSVSAHATNIGINAQGFAYRNGTQGGGEFRSGGIHRELGGLTLPVSPEEAVRFVSLATGRKVDEIPLLGTPGNRVVQIYARWRLHLTEPAVFERLFDGSRVETDEVYVGAVSSIADAREGLSPRRASLRMFVAAEQQPEVEVINDVNVPLRQGYSVDLHEAIVAP